MSDSISLKELLEAGCHFGHQARRWNPKMKRFIYQKREGVHIFDLAQTAQRLEAAMAKAREISAGGGKIVFIGTKRQASAVIKEEAIRCGMPYVAVRWLGGIITNWDQLKKSLDELTGLESKKQSGELKKYTKRENVLIDRKIDKLNRFLGGLRTLTGQPETIFVVDVKEEIAAVREARRKGVTVIAVTDTNVDPDLVDFPIPANDDAVASIKYIVAKISQAVLAGKAVWEKSKLKPLKK
jgi:small subunit ribosomal protein S2